MNHPDLYVVCKRRDGRGKWERTGEGSQDAFLEKSEAVIKVQQYKANVPHWNFAYALYRNGKLGEMMGL